MLFLSLPLRSKNNYCPGGKFKNAPNSVSQTSAHTPNLNVLYCKHTEDRSTLLEGFNCVCFIGRISRMLITGCLLRTAGQLLSLLLVGTMRDQDDALDLRHEINWEGFKCT